MSKQRVSRFLSALVALSLVACAPAAMPAQPILATFTAMPSPTALVEPTVAPEATALPTLAATEPADVPAAATAEPTVTTPAFDVIQHLIPGDRVSLKDLAMVEAGAGWGIAEGSYGFDVDDHVLRTADGGRSWVDVTPPQPVRADYALGSAVTLFALDDQTAWAVFYDRQVAAVVPPMTVWRTTDGGTNWIESTPLDVTDAAFFAPTELTFVDAQNGWLLAHVDSGMMHDYVMVFGTDDGGATWERRVDPTNQALTQSCAKTGIVFTDAQTGWITGDCQGVQNGAPYLERTTDGGLTWEPVVLPAPQGTPSAYAGATTACGLQAPAVVDDQTTYLTVSCENYDTGAVAAYIYRTADSGASWFSRQLPAGFEQASFVSARLGWIMAGGDGGGEGPFDLWQTFDGAQSFNRIETVDWSGQLSFISSREGWAVRQDSQGAGVLLHTTNGGQDWDVIEPEVIAP